MNFFSRDFLNRRGFPKPPMGKMESLNVWLFEPLLLGFQPNFARREFRIGVNRRAIYSAVAQRSR